MSIGDVAVLRIVGRYQDQNIVNTMHYEVEDQATGDAVLWDTLIDGWIGDHETLWLGEHIDAYTLIGLKAFTVKGDTRPPGERTRNNAGTIAENPAPAFVCRTITFYSESSNPRVRGRLMLSGSSEAMFHDDDGSVVAGQIITMQALGDQLLGELVDTGNTFKPVLYSKLLDATNDLLAAKARITPSSVRSRRVKRMLIG